MPPSSKRRKSQGQTPTNSDAIFVAVPAEFLEFRDGAGKPASRSDLMQQFRDGELHELGADIIAYRQSRTKRPLPVSKASEANANFMHFHETGFKRFGRSFKGGPFLIDHDSSIHSKGGKIVDSTVEASDDELVVKQSIKAVKDWAVEDLLDGTIEEFSIGAGPGDGFSAACSVCRCDFLSMDCPHMPGEVVDLDEKSEPVIVEVVLKNIEGRETSGVTFPAVSGTGIESVGNFSQAKSQLIKSKEPDSMNEKTRKLLNLSEDADGAAIEAAVLGLAGQHKAAADKTEELELALAAEQATSAELKSKVTELETSVETEKTEKRETAVKALHDSALSGEGFGGALFATGDPREAYFLKVAERDIEEARIYLGTLSPGVVGAPLQSGKKPGKDEPARKLSARELKLCKIMKVTPEQYLAADDDDEDKDAA